MKDIPLFLLIRLLHWREIDTSVDAVHRVPTISGGQHKREKSTFAQFLPTLAGVKAALIGLTVTPVHQDQSCASTLSRLLVDSIQQVTPDTFANLRWMHK